MIYDFVYNDCTLHRRYTEEIDNSPFPINDIIEI